MRERGAAPACVQRSARQTAQPGPGRPALNGQQGAREHRAHQQDTDRVEPSCANQKPRPHLSTAGAAWTGRTPCDCTPASAMLLRRGHLLRGNALWMQRRAKAAPWTGLCTWPSRCDNGRHAGSRIQLAPSHAARGAGSARLHLAGSVGVTPTEPSGRSRGRVPKATRAHGDSSQEVHTLAHVGGHSPLSGP